MWQLWVLLVSLVAASDEGLLVTTHNGKIQGKLMDIQSGKTIRAFLGIRYAKPPVGELRFMPPVQLQKWSGVQKATDIHPLCPQLNTYVAGSQIEGEEDCLFLNVYAQKTTNKDILLPVMVFIHGGGFIFGSGNTQFYGPDSLMEEDVILVAMNYRLGPFGFLSTSDEVVPGNNGLKDQTMALRWIQEHIKYFGGDPSKVTIFGESAGGASAHYHVISSHSKGLFRASISQSGSALCPWALSSKEEGYEMGRKLATLLDCPTKCSKEMVTCLRNIDVKKIVDMYEKLLIWDIDPLAVFTPVIEIDHEGAFISQHPEDIIKSGKVNDVSWMTGLTTEDGAIRSSGIIGAGRLDEYKNNFKNIAPVSMFYKGRTTNEKEYTDKIHDFYFNKDFTTEKLTNMYTDYLFLHGAEKALNLHRMHSNIPLYYYLFAYKGSLSFTQVFGDKTNDYGVCHADELIYLFPMESFYFNGAKLTKDDKLMTKTLTQLWTNFAKYKEPTALDTNWSHVQWEPVKTENNEYFVIGSSSDFKMDQNMYPDRVQFWKDLQSLMKQKTSRDEL